RRLDLETSFGGRALLDKTVVPVDDVQAIKSATAGQRSRASGARTVLWAPLILAADAIGVLIIRRREVRSFTEDEVHLVESFAEMAALAIENARLKAETE